MESNQHNEPLISLYRAARRLRLSPSRLSEAVRAGHLPAIRPGSRTTYVRWPDVERWIREQSVRLAEEARR